MAGIYIHIPFCSKACHYCDFHFSTNFSLKEKMVDAIISEIRLRKDYLDSESIETIYFGGGTPSVLNATELDAVLNAVSKNHSISTTPEITLEANPEDLSKAKLKELFDVGVNRLSIGLQSFVAENLILMNRAHNVEQGIRSVKQAQDIGLTNITIDLMYGLPGLSEKQWKDNLTTALALDVDHISAYCLTIEAKTVFAKWLENNKIIIPKDEVSASQMQALIDTLGADNYEHYEISNFARKEMYSKHNTAYWQQKKYIGVGPSAHSYNAESRSWNVSNNPVYVKNLAQGKLASEVEILSEKDKLNEYIMTGLRTKWGIDSSKINNVQLNLTELNQGVNQFIEQGYLTKKDNVITLTSEGKHVADRIASELFVVD